MRDGQYLLYGVEASYYAAKIRSYFLQKNLPFKELTCDRRAFDEVILPRLGFPVVPVVITPQDETLQDTAEIIDMLEPRHPTPSLIPSSPRRRFAAYLLELYADEWLKLPALHYRWYYDYEFAHTMMGQNNDPTASPEEQRRVGAKIAAEFKTWPEHLGVNESTRTAVEASFLECMALLDAHFEIYPYALGETPSIADCALMGPLYAHLYRDPYSGKIVRANAPHLCQWIERMRHPNINANANVNPAQRNDSDGALPETLIPVLQHLGSEYVPVLSTAMPLLQAWLGSHRGEEMPRYAGKHRFTLGSGKSYEAQGIRSIHPFEQWKVQRVQDVFRSFNDDDQKIIISLCDEIKAAGLLTLNFPIALSRKNYRLIAA